MINKKLFECNWGSWDSNATNTYDDNRSTKAEDFFSADNGYTESDIKSIREMAPGQSVTCEYGNHTVKRLQ
jgi:hypothetical protein